MRKILIITQIMFSFTYVSKSQDYFSFPEEDAVWNHFFETCEGTKLDYYYSTYYALGLYGDTTINSLEYSKLYLLEDSVYNSNAELQGYIREDSLKRVYYVGPNFWGHYEEDEVLLYDFSVSVGDTIDYGIWEGTVIKSIDSVLIGDSYRKRFCVWENYDYYIEGIGSTNGLLFPITDIPVKVYTNWDLVCFKHFNEVLFLGDSYNSCFPEFIVSNYFPLVEGNTWEYNEIYLYQVFDTVSFNGLTYIKYGESEENPDFYFRWDSIGKLYAYNTFLNEEYLWFDFNLKMGDTCEIAFGDPDYIGIVQVEGIWVETPAGLFKRCIKVLFDIPQSIDDEYWYYFAPEIGIVKMTGAWMPEMNLTSYDVSILDGVEFVFVNSPKIDFIIYPNPLLENTVLNIKSDENIQAEVVIYSLYGTKVKSVFNGLLTKGVNKIPVDNISLYQGIYIIRIITQLDNYEKKVIFLK